MGDWRLRGQERYLKDVELCWVTYKPCRAGWDHDHCSFCWQKFSTREEDFSQGYVTKDGYYWICRECYQDFRRMFNWKVAAPALHNKAE